MLERLTTWLAGDLAPELIPSHVAFNVPLAPEWCVLLLIALGSIVLLFYWPRLSTLRWPVRLLLVSLRTAALCLALFLLLDPSVIAQRIRPGEQFVLMLFDDSRSMQIAGEDGMSRGERMVRAYEAAKNDFEDVLRRKHQVVQYRFGDAIEPIREVRALDFEQTESDLAGAIGDALAEYEGTTVSAVVLFSDGVQQTDADARDIEGLAGGVPVYAVGVDTASAWRDIEIAELSVRRTDFDKSPVVLNIDTRAQGLAGHEAVVEVVQNGRVVKSSTIRIAENEQRHNVRIEFVPAKEGWQVYDARVRLAGPGPTPDRIERNNSRSFVVDNRPKTYKVLYVSSRPSWENKFVRRAVEADTQLQLTSVIAISKAEPKFVFKGKRSNLSNPLFEGFDEDRDRPRYDEAVLLRLGPDSKNLSGYPADAETLFGYDLVIFGDVEREFFTADQLDLTRQFVEKRGGSLLVMGGPNSFTEGNYNGTVIENMLPVAMYPDYESGGAARVERPFTVAPTVDGSLSGAWSFATNYEENRAEWGEMPNLFGLNRFLMVRPGATVMAEASSDQGNFQGQPLFAVQRYGEGRCGILATSDTWQWQLGLDEQDDKHGQLWRQIVRNLVHDTPEPVSVREKKDVETRNNPVSIDFVVRDSVYDRREGLQCAFTLATPAGRASEVTVEESIRDTGTYSAQFVPDQTGLYTYSLTAHTAADEDVASLEEALLVVEDGREYQHAQYDADYLSALAEPTGGRVYALAQLGELAEAIPIPVRREAEEIRLHLWHQPVFFAALVTMMIAEWYLRRRRGYA